jgi:hypothetical protein
LPACVSEGCGGDKGQYLDKANRDQQQPEGPFLALA